MRLTYIMLFSIFAFGLQAQDFNVHFSNPEVDNISNPAELCVELELSYTATATLGFSNFVFDFDETVLSNPRIAQSYLNSEYNVSAVTTSALNATSLGDVADVRLTYDFENGTEELTLTGTANCNSTTGIARICFDVLNAGVTTDLEWVYDGDGSTTATNVNTHISSLTSTTATQLDANGTTSGNCSLTDISIDIAGVPGNGGGGVSCEEFITYSSTTISSGTYRAVNDIETVSGGSGVTVGAGSSVTLDAGDVIVLRPGFTAENGSNFVAQLGGCTLSIQGDDLVANRSEDVFSEEMQIEVAPNPAYSEARIRFFSPEEEYVIVNIYDMNGKIVEQLHQQYAMKGWNQLTFYPKSLSSGLYFVSVQSRTTVKTKRLVVQGN